MTTPERLRRRQIIEGVLLILIGFAMLGQTWYFNEQDREQRDCLGDNFAELTVTLTARADLAERESAATKRLWLINAEAAGLLKDDPTRPLTPQEQARLQAKLVDALLDYEKVINSVERSRREHPVPPYPVGECRQE